MSRSARWGIGLLAVGLLLAGLLVARLLGRPAASEQASGLTFSPSQEQQRRMRELEASLDRELREFPSEEAHRKENGQLFSYMALTHEDPILIQASLKAVVTSYGSRSTKKASPDGDLDLVLLTHLASNDPAIARLAFDALRIPLMADVPSQQLIGALLSRSQRGSDTTTRYQALEVLDLIRPNLRPRAVVLRYSECLADPEPIFSGRCVLALLQSGPAIDVLEASDQALIARELWRLLRHESPGVRGRALVALSVLRLAEQAELGAETLRLLGDPHPHVRASAMDAALRLGLSEAIAPLVSQVDDMSGTETILLGPKEPSGTPLELSCAVAGRPRVADAALYTLLALVRERSDLPPLELSLGGPRRSAESVRAAAARAKSWFEQAAHLLSAGP